MIDVFDGNRERPGCGKARVVRCRDGQRDSRCRLVIKAHPGLEFQAAIHDFKPVVVHSVRDRISIRIGAQDRPNRRTTVIFRDCCAAQRGRCRRAFQGFKVEIQNNRIVIPVRHRTSEIEFAVHVLETNPVVPVRKNGHRDIADFVAGLVPVANFLGNDTRHSFMVGAAPPNASA